MNLNKQPLTKENLTVQVSDIDIYHHYLGHEVTMQTGMSSPFREDKKPSFGFFIGNSGEICWKDFKEGTGDCISFVQKFFNLNFNEALIKIAMDFNVDDEFDFIPIRTVQRDTANKVIIDRSDFIKKLSEDKHIDIHTRKAELYDYQFWMQFGITRETLIRYNVTPIEYYLINGHIIKTDKYAYAFIEYKDNKETYKIYQPFNKDYKWINNHNDSVWQGWAQLPENGLEVIITKSLKDVMCIQETLGIPTVALQSESVLPKKSVINELFSRFNDVYILYDNDYDSEKNWGQIYSKRLAEEFQLYHLKIDASYKCKDFSDLVKEYGSLKAKDIWDRDISLPF
jgi:hypothetical protein